MLYQSPVQVGPANPLYPQKTGYKATMSGFPYDDLDGWRGPYPADVFVAQFEQVAEGWRLGLVPLQAAVEKAPPERRAEAQAELRYAKAAALHFQSVANQAAFVLARDMLAERGDTLSPGEWRNCGPRCGAACNRRSCWPTGSSPWRARIRGSALKPRPVLLLAAGPGGEGRQLPLAVGATEAIGGQTFLLSQHGPQTSDRQDMSVLLW